MAAIAPILEEATDGSTIPSIAGALPIAIGLPQTALVERHGAIRLPTGNPTPANKSGDRVATSPVIGPAVAWAIVRVVADFYPRLTAAALELGLAIVRVAAERRVTAAALELGPPTVLVAVQTESETGICHAPLAEAEERSAAAPKASTERALEPTPTAVLPAWDREAASRYL